MNTMKWLLKREFWENKGGFFWAPLIAGGLFVLLNVMMGLVSYAAADRSQIQFGMMKLDQAMASLDPEILRQAGVGLDMATVIITALVMLISAIVVFFYLIGSLYDERRDRSILFWKSLPLSDTQTVVSKVIAATLIAPAIGLVAGIVTAMLMLLFVAISGLFYGQNFFGIIFSIANPFKVALVLLSTLPIAALWSLPTVGWLMLCSVWARSKPFLWAVALPVAAGIMVGWFDLMRSLQIPDTWFWKHVVARMLFSVAPGAWLWSDGARFENIRRPEDLTSLVTVGEVYTTLGSPDLWIGAAAGVAMLVLAVRIRRWRDEA
jgi:ABC-2 type transport system permease protein